MLVWYLCVKLYILFWVHRVHSEFRRENLGPHFQITLYFILSFILIYQLDSFMQVDKWWNILILVLLCHTIFRCNIRLVLVFFWGYDVRSNFLRLILYINCISIFSSLNTSSNFSISSGKTLTATYKLDLFSTPLYTVANAPFPNLLFRSISNYEFKSCSVPAYSKWLILRSYNSEELLISFNRTAKW